LLPLLSYFQSDLVAVDLDAVGEEADGIRVLAKSYNPDGQRQQV